MHKILLKYLATFSAQVYVEVIQIQIIYSYLKALHITQCKFKKPHFKKQNVDTSPWCYLF